MREGRGRPACLAVWIALLGGGCGLTGADDTVVTTTYVVRRLVTRRRRATG